MIVVAPSDGANVVRSKIIQKKNIPSVTRDHHAFSSWHALCPFRGSNLQIRITFPGASYFKLPPRLLGRDLYFGPSVMTFETHTLQH